MTSRTNDINDAICRPLSELRMNLRLRRQLMRAGFSTLAEALDAPEGEIDDRLSDEAFDAWYLLLSQLEKDPGRLAANLTTPIDQERIAEVRRSIAASKDDAITERRQHANRPAQRKSASEEKALNPLPKSELTTKLLDLEFKANASLSILADHNESALIAERFPSLTLTLDDIEEAFIGLFARYADRPSKALMYARLYFPNAFLVFVSNAASNDFDGDAFWKNMFEKIGVESQAIQNDIKRAYYHGVKDKGLPHFTAEDNDFHYLNTALLHGGFSESFWRPMWSDIILPYSKSSHTSWLSKKSGSELLRSIKSGNGSMTLQRTYAKRIIEKAPPTMLEPLLDSALAVAFEINDSEKSYSGLSSRFEMMSSHGLSDAAMQALRNILERQGSGGSRRLVYLPSAEMRLDPANGRIHLHWDAQKFPQHFAGRSIEYRVNGRLEHIEPFIMSVGKCLLPELDLSLSPNERFDVELVLIDSDKMTTLATLAQTFDRTKPGSFEFVQGSDEVFRLRKKHERIAKTKNLAYLTKAELWVAPGAGMRSLEYYDAEEGWNGASIQIFEVDPGSSGSIINLLTKEEVACWQENYRVEIDRSHAIGKSSDKRDLYGFDYNEIGTNYNLPDIFIETLDVNSVRDDIEIRCECDGSRVSLPWEIHQDEVDHELVPSGSLVIKPSGTQLINKFVRRGFIAVHQKSSGAPILNYKFSVIPVRSFGIEELFWDSETVWATYKFEALDPITVPGEDGDYEMVKHDFYYLDAPLESERESMRIRNDKNGATIDVTLSLAGLDMSIPDDLARQSKERPICASDADCLDGRISLKSNGRRQTRAIYVSMGSLPLMLKKLRGNATHSFDIFRDPARFTANGDEEDRNVSLTVSYGEQRVKGRTIPASASLELVRCTTGFGLGKASLRRKSAGLCLCFENASSSNMEVRFYDRHERKSFGSAEIPEGQTFAVIPRDAAYQLDTRKTVIAKVFAMSLFGDVDENSSMTIKLSR